MKTEFSILTMNRDYRSETSLNYTTGKFEILVEGFLKDKILISANFQRNLFYPRSGTEFQDNLQETYTAFILWNSSSEGTSEELEK